MKFTVNRRALRKRTDEFGVILSSGSVRLLEEAHKILCCELQRADVENRLEEILQNLIPEGKAWFSMNDTKNTNDYVFESSTHLLSICIANGLESMLEWLLRVAKCWLDSRNASYLCTRDLECIMEKSPLYAFYNDSSIKHESQQLIVLLDDANDAECYLKKPKVLFNNSVETARQDNEDIGGIKETLEKLMERITMN